MRKSEKQKPQVTHPHPTTAWSELTRRTETRVKLSG